MVSCASKITKEGFGTQITPTKSLRSKTTPTVLDSTPTATPGSSSQGGGVFPNMHNIYNLMQETLHISRNALTTGQGINTRFGGIGRNVASMRSGITYIREHMAYHDEEGEEKMESD
ncbi:hypothetical protein Hanom_Chr10g00910601 [Helianthus anomalus]